MKKHNKAAKKGIVSKGKKKVIHSKKDQTKLSKLKTSPDFIEQDVLRQFNDSKYFNEYVKHVERIADIRPSDSTH